MIKKIIKALFASIFIFSCLINTVFAEVIEYSWYIKRNGNKRPLMQREEALISQYDGYYIDKKVTDSSNDKVIYLTFDLGYENGNTEKILDTLKSESVPAAFFVLDNIILKNTELVTRMANENHLVCNHTKNHKNLSRMTMEEIEKNLSDLEKIYEEKTGNKLSKYFRFPEGRYSEYSLKCVQSLGYKSIFWSFAYEDWDNHRQPNPNSAIRKILSNTHNGAVFLFHPTSETNAKIFPCLIKEWKSLGYRFGTLDELVS